MNRKTIVTAVAMLACGAALAVETTNTLCRIRIDSNRKETILSIPLITVGTDGSASPKIDVTKYVLTDGLSNGDKLQKRSNGKWESWTFNGTTWVGNTTASGNEVAVTGSELPLGDCIRLIRSDTTKPIYLYGELPTNSAKIQTASAGVWTMLGNVKPVAVSLSTFTGKCTVKPVEGDIIALPTSSDSANASGITQYYYDGTKWGYDDWANANTVTLPSGRKVLTAPFVSGDDVSIPEGEGFWYVRKSGEAALSVTW